MARDLSHSERVAREADVANATVFPDDHAVHARVVGWKHRDAIPVSVDDFGAKAAQLVQSTDAVQTTEKAAQILLDKLGR